MHSKTMGTVSDAVDEAADTASPYPQNHQSHHKQESCHHDGGWMGEHPQWVRGRLYQKPITLTAFCQAFWDTSIIMSAEHISDLSLTHGTSMLCDVHTFEQLSRNIQDKIISMASPPPQHCGAGGTCANLVRVMTALSETVSFTTIVGKDEEGQRFRQALSGDALQAHILAHHAHTGKVWALVSEDAQRTMVVYPGSYPQDFSCSQWLVWEDLLSSQMFHFCGYQWQNFMQKKAIKDALSLAREQSLIISFDLGDPMVVRSFREDFRDLVRRYVTVLFANAWELKELLLADEEDVAASDLFANTMVVEKLGDQGARVWKNQVPEHVPPQSGPPVVDTTGAGDVFAGGFLSGLAQGLSSYHAATLGSLLARDVISRLGTQVSEEALTAAQNYLKCWRP